jgi:hypothetical protein
MIVLLLFLIFIALLFPGAMRAGIGLLVIIGLLAAAQHM